MGVNPALLTRLTLFVTDTACCGQRARAVLHACDTAGLVLPGQPDPGHRRHVLRRAAAQRRGGRRRRSSRTIGE